MRWSSALITMPINTLAKNTLRLPRLAKRAIVLMLDGCLCILAVWLAFYLRLGIWVPLSVVPNIAFISSICMAIPVFIFFGMYRAIFRHHGWPALITVAKATTIYAIGYATLFTAFGVEGVPRTVGIIQPILMFLFIGILRAFARFFLSGSLASSRRELAPLSRALIYGAGSAGRQLAEAMRNGGQVQVLGYLDDDSSLHGGIINGLRIFNPKEVKDLVRVLSVTDVLLAIPSVSRAQRNSILESMSKVRVSIRTLPNLNDLAQGKITASDIRDLDIEDLLGRDPVKPHLDLLKKNITDEVVLVTGAGGSIGSELCRQILAQNPKTLVLLEQSEYALYAIHQQLLKSLDMFGTSIGKSILLAPVLGSVQDSAFVSSTLEKFCPNTIFHAAAYKHVPLVEENYVQGIKNNVCGTQVMALSAIQWGVKNFVLISTDKAVRPTNIMGATKRISEMILQALSNSPKNTVTKFSMVRFGNVLDSSGSVVPLFRRQIKDGGPITLTHSEVTRYFMTIPEAASLVIQAGAMSEGGEVFVLDMGEPVKIIDLARHMIELSGLEECSIERPDGDIKIEVTGLRPGEKLYEELLIGNSPIPTQHQRVMKAQEEYLDEEDLGQKLRQLNQAIEFGNLPEVQSILKSLVAGYQPALH